MYDYNCYIVLLNIKNVFMCSELHYIELEIFLKHLKTAKAPDVKDWADVVETCFFLLRLVCVMYLLNLSLFACNRVSSCKPA